MLPRVVDCIPDFLYHYRKSDMEELQTTEILDREILEDARKKAFRILKAADDTVKIKSGEWERKLSAELEELEHRYAEQEKTSEQEIMAVLPIDKRRTKAKKTEELLRSAVQNWYAGLSRPRVLEILRNELALRVSACGNLAASSGIRVLISDLDETEARAILREALPDRPGKQSLLSIESIHSSSPYPQLILETPSVRIYASIGKAVEYYLGEKRAELVESLLGGGGTV